MKMQQLLIPKERVKALTRDKTLQLLREKLGCSIEIANDNELGIEGEAYDEYNARNVLVAFGRGFDLKTSLKLLEGDFFFTSINLKEEFKTPKSIHRMKARLIGMDGKTKTYIENVSNVSISIYGNTISFIGSVDDIKIANSAIEILLEGGTHKKAYALMEKLRRKAREESMRAHR